MRSRRFIALFCAGAVLAACSGGNTPLPGFGASSSSSSIHGVPKKKDGRIRFRIRVPKKRVAGRRGPRFVSPATQGLVVGIACTNVGCNTSVNETVPLTPTANGCSSSLATTVCTFTFLLPPGGYTATLTTYDAISCSGSCTIPGGANELSMAQAIPFTVSAGVTNSVALTLSGLVSSVIALPMTANSVLGVNRTIDMFGTSAHKMLVEALDADGNIIFGAGSPTFTVALGTGSLAVTLGQPTTAQPNVFTVTPPSAYASTNRTINITGSFTGQPTNGCSGNACNASVTVDMKQLIATQSFNQALVYETGQTSPFATITGLANVSTNSGGTNGIAFDPSGNLFIALCNRGCNNGGQPDAVAIFAPPYTGSPTYITSGVTDPQALLTNSAGQLYVGNCGTCFVYGTDSVNIYTPPFTASSSPTSTIVSGVVQPQAMVLDTNNPPNLYVANCVSCKTYAATDTVVQYANSGLGAAATLPANSLSDPVALAVDGDEDVFVANYNGNKGGGSVGVYFAPAFSGGANIVTAADTTTLVSPVALWPDGATTGSCTGLIKVPCVMMIADAGNSKVFSCGPSFTTQCGSGQTIGSGVNTPTAVAEDGSNNLYVANNGNNTLRSFAAPAFTTGTTISTKNNTPFGLAVLP